MPKSWLLPKADQQRYQSLLRIMEIQLTGVHYQQRETVTKFCYLGSELLDSSLTDKEVASHNQKSQHVLRQAGGQ